MGYYSRTMDTLHLKEGVEEELLEKIQQVRDKGVSAGRDSYLFYHITDDITVEDDEITFYEDDRKWYALDELMVFLEPFIADEEQVIFQGEEGDTWGYRFRDGKAVTLVSNTTYKEVPL